MNIMPGAPPPVLGPGENAHVSVERTLGGSVRFTIRDARYPGGYYADLPPQNAIAAAGAMIEATGTMNDDLKAMLRRLIDAAPKANGGLIIP